MQSGSFAFGRICLTSALDRKQTLRKTAKINLTPGGTHPFSVWYHQPMYIVFWPLGGLLLKIRKLVSAKVEESSADKLSI